MVLDFIAKGEKLMTDQNCPKFLEGHVKKLREAWEDTNEKAQIRSVQNRKNFFRINFFKVLNKNVNN